MRQPLYAVSVSMPRAAAAGKIIDRLAFARQFFESECQFRNDKLIFALALSRPFLSGPRA